MALTAYSRLRMLWGALDWQAGGGSPYSSAQTVSGGPSAVAGSGIGVRRASLIFARTTTGTFAEDVMVCHFDWLNLTGGSPDDTWTSGDYTNIEGDVTAFWTAMLPQISNRVTLREIRWYRVGSGVTPPNPPEHITTVGVAGTSTNDELPPQVAMSVTFKTAVRKSWGRTYLPGFTEGSNAGDGRILHAESTAVADKVSALVVAGAGHDFHLVVVSKHLSAALNVETIQVDDVWDVIRRRRYANPIYREVRP